MVLTPEQGRTWHTVIMCIRLNNIAGIELKINNYLGVARSPLPKL